MASRRRVQWLEGQIDQWAAEGILPRPVEVALRDRAAAMRSGTGGLPVFAVLGAALIGLGIVLLLAHNWAELARPVRAALSIGLLGAGQAAAAFALLRRSSSTSWSEAAATFCALAFAASIALLSQTYQIPGDLGSFLEVWWWATLPLAYALRSRTAAVLSLLQAMALLAYALTGELATWPHWLRLAALVPLSSNLGLFRSAQDAPAGTAPGLRDGLFASAGILALASSSVLGLAFIHPAASLVGASAVAAGLISIATRTRATSLERPIDAPARWLGLLTLAGLSYSMSFSGLWELVTREASIGSSATLWLPALLIAGCAAAVAVSRATEAESTERSSTLIAIAQPVLLALGAWLVHGNAELDGPVALAMTGHALALGANEVFRGVRLGERLRSNFGAVLLICVIGFRFVAWDLSFTLRGLAFIAAGIAFLIMNLRLSRRESREHARAEARS